MIPYFAQPSLTLGPLTIHAFGAIAGGAGFRFRWSATAVVARTHVAPVPGGGNATEVNVVEPMLMVRGEGFGRHLVVDGTLDLEGLTIPNGVLGIGDWGEGFNDRRHLRTRTRSWSRR